MKSTPDLSQAFELFGQPTKPQNFIVVLSRLPAGFPSPAADHVEEGLDFNEFLVRNKAATYVFTVTGDSMSGAGIENGDKVVVDRSLSPAHDDIVVALVNNEFTIKRLFKRRGQIELRPDNPAYPPITFEEGSELQVWGVVVGVVRKYTRKRRGL